MSNFKNAYIEQIRPIIAYNYFVLGKKKKEIAKIFSISVYAVRTSCLKWQDENLAKIYDPGKAFLIIEKNKAEEAVEILRGFGIESEVARHSGSVSQEYESSINLK